MNFAKVLLFRETCFEGSGKSQVLLSRESVPWDLNNITYAMNDDEKALLFIISKNNDLFFVCLFF